MEKKKATKKLHQGKKLKSTKTLRTLQPVDG